MDDVTRFAADSRKTIDALSKALDRAYEALEDIQFVDDVDDAVLLSEDVCEEITSSLVNAGVSSDLIPGATV